MVMVMLVLGRHQELFELFNESTIQCLYGTFHDFSVLFQPFAVQYIFQVISSNRLIKNLYFIQTKVQTILIFGTKYPVFAPYL